MKLTYTDELVEYPAKVISLIANSDECVSLLINKSSELLNDDDRDNFYDNVFDYSFVNSTTQTASTYIFVECDVVKAKERIKDVEIYIQVACHKDLMKLDRKLFPGRLGNRRDSLCVEIDKCLNGANIFDIGKLALVSIKSGNLQNGFAVRELVYKTNTFNR